MKSLLLLALVVIVCHPALAQEQIKPTESSDPAVTERIRLLESELERQSTKLDQLQKTIADQQQAIQALLINSPCRPSRPTRKQPRLQQRSQADGATAPAPPQAPTVETATGESRR
jgi:hypothetical protein